MENMNTKQRYKFMCGRWLSKKEEDKQIIRELPADGPGIKKPLRLTKYTVDVHTGKRANAGTDANVFVNIFGECGDTGGKLCNTRLRTFMIDCFFPALRTTTGIF